MVKFFVKLFLLGVTTVHAGSTTAQKEQQQQQEQSAPGALRSGWKNTMKDAITSAVTAAATTTTTTRDLKKEDEESSSPLSDAFLAAVDEQILWILRQPETISDTAVVSVATNLLQDEFAMLSDGTMSCAWGRFSQGGELQFNDENEYFPDTVANYWITRITIPDNLPSWFPTPEIIVSGIEPNARYYSFQTYTISDFYTTVQGSIIDNDIIINPIDDSYEILVNGIQGNPNELSSFPEGDTSGTVSLMFRTYLSDPDSSPAGGVDLPLITMKYGNFFEQTLDYCNDAEPKIKVKTPKNPEPEYEFTAVPNTGPVRWFLTLSGTSVPYPNMDVGYLSTVIHPVKDHVVVIRGKAPEYMNNEDVRYWSVCKFGLPSTATNGCVYDEIATLDDDHYFTVVIASKKPKGPKGTKENPAVKFDYLEFGPEIFGVVGLRHMLPSGSFYHNSIQAINDIGSDDKDVNDGLARDTLQEYYPETRYCPLSVFEEFGPLACFKAQ